MDLRWTAGVICTIILASLALGSCGSSGSGGAGGRVPVGDPFLVTPDRIIAPSETSVGVPTEIKAECWITAVRDVVDWHFLVDEPGRECVINVYCQNYDYPNGIILAWAGIHTVSVAVTFPAPGEWTIRSGGKSVPITVLPAEGGGEQ